MIKAYVIERVPADEADPPAYFSVVGWLPPVILPLRPGEARQGPAVPPAAATFGFVSEALEAIRERQRNRDPMFPPSRQYRSKPVTIDDDGRTLTTQAATEYSLYGDRTS